MKFKEFLLVCDDSTDVVTLDRNGEYIDSHVSYQANVETLVEFDAEVLYVYPIRKKRILVVVDFDWKEFCNDHD